MSRCLELTKKLYPGLAGWNPPCPTASALPALASHPYYSNFVCVRVCERCLQSCLARPHVVIHPISPTLFRQGCKCPLFCFSYPAATRRTLCDSRRFFFSSFNLGAVGSVFLPSTRILTARLRQSPPPRHAHSCHLRPESRSRLQTRREYQLSKQHTLSVSRFRRSRIWKRTAVPATPPPRSITQNSSAALVKKEIGYPGKVPWRGRGKN